MNWLHGRRTDGTPRREARFAAIIGALVAFALFAFLVPGGILEHVARSQGWL